MTPAVDQRQIIPKRKCRSPPKIYAPILAQDPFAISSVQKDLGVKTLGPFKHRRVEMRMRNRDGADAAACAYLGECFVVQQRDAIPEQISSGRLQKQSALTYRKFRFGADSQKPRRFLFETIMVVSRKAFERRPFLAGVTDELPFIFANWAVRRRVL